MSAHVVTELLVASNEIGVVPGALEGTVVFSFKMPHIQLPCERSVFGLTKEERQQLEKLIGLMNQKGSPVVDPAHNIVEPLGFDIFQEVVEPTWEHGL